MSMHMYTTVCFGFEFTEPKREDFWDWMDEVNNSESKVGIEYMGEEHTVIFALDSSIDQGYYDDTKFIQLPMSSTTYAQWESDIFNFCLEHNLVYTQPTWIFASYYM